MKQQLPQYLVSLINIVTHGKKVPFERYCFNWRQQEEGKSYEQYRTALCKLSITPDEILRDRLIFGIKDDKVHE